MGYFVPQVVGTCYTRFIMYSRLRRRTCRQGRAESTRYPERKSYNDGGVGFDMLGTTYGVSVFQFQFSDPNSKPTPSPSCPSPQPFPTPMPKKKDGSPSNPESDDGGDGSSDDTEPTPEPMPEPTDPESEDGGDGGDDGEDSAEPTPAPTPTPTESDSPDDNTEAPAAPGGDDSGDGECADPVLEHDQVRAIPRTSEDVLKRERSRERCRGCSQHWLPALLSTTLPMKLSRTFLKCVARKYVRCFRVGIISEPTIHVGHVFFALCTGCAHCSVCFSPCFRLSFSRQSLADLRAGVRADLFIFAVSCQLSFVGQCGGTDYTGSTCCESGLQCQKMAECWSEVRIPRILR